MNEKEYFNLVDQYCEKFGRCIPIGLQVSEKKLKHMLEEAIKTGVPIPDDDHDY